MARTVKVNRENSGSSLLSTSVGLLQPLGTIAPPGVRVRLRISFSSAQRLTRASESTPGPQETAGGWDTAVRAGLGSRCAP